MAPATGGSYHVRFIAEYTEYAEHMRGKNESFVLFVWRKSIAPQPTATYLQGSSAEGP